MKLACDPITLEGRMIDEALEALTRKPVTTTTLERVRLFAQADDLFPDDMPQPLKYGHGLAYVLERVSLPIREGDLLLGRIAEEVPDAEGEAFFQEVCRRFARRKEPLEKWSMPFWVLDGGHTSFYWKDVVALGLSGLRDRAEQRLEQARTQGEGREVEDFLTGAILCYEALQHYLLRYATAAGELGMHEAAEACRRAAGRPPQTFREALQMLWAIMLVYCSLLAGNPTLTFGRMDLLLQPLYERDLAQGRLTRQEAGLLILDFYCKNNLIMGRGEHQMSYRDERLTTGWHRNLNYDAPQYLILAGSRPEGGSAVSDLTLLFAQQVVPRFKNPVMVIRYAPGMMEQHPGLWRVLVDKMRQSASMMVYNEQDIIAAYIRAGVDPQDAAQFEHYGCNWPIIPGMDGGGCGHLGLWGTVSPEEREGLRGGDWQMRPGGITGAFLRIFEAFAQDPDGAHTIEDFYGAMSDAYEAYVEGTMRRAALERSILLRHRPGPLHLQDLFFKDTIQRGADFLCGGSKYYSIGNSYAGFASLVDCLTTVDTLVYRQKKLTLAQLAAAVAKNFEGESHIHALCRAVPKLGSDEALANAHGRRMLTLLTEACSRVTARYKAQDTAENRMTLRQSIESDTSHIHLGAELGATPDGRLAGLPLSQNSQPAVGSSVNGLTAMLTSLAQLPWQRIMSGALNISIQPRLFAGEQGLTLLASILGTYFEMGGLQTQISAVDAQTLREAQRDPDAHRDLMVRITGYSAVFVDMTEAAQNEIIRREEHLA